MRWPKQTHVPRAAAVASAVEAAVKVTVVAAAATVTSRGRIRGT